MRKYLTEFVGTFFFLLTIGLIVVSGNPMAPLVIGAVLMVIVYMGGHVSGGHYNPAVSVAVFLRGKLPAGELIPYIVAQVAGATLGAWLAYHVSGKSFAPAPGPEVSPLHVLLIEGVYTLLLCLVVLNVATSKRTEGNSYYGLAIGFAIVVAAFAGGPLSGGAFNPAIGTGSILISHLSGNGGLGNLWLYWVGPVAGGIVAAFIFKYQEQDA